jgi:5-oxoprolinase (ATP-hydrolysing) subunit A
VRAGREAGLAVVEEVFADRQYTDEGHLVPRSHPQAMVHGAEASVHHVMAMLDGAALVSIHGKRLPCAVGSICVHGDNTEAVATARALRAALQAAGYQLAGLPALAA